MRHGKVTSLNNNNVRPFLDEKSRKQVNKVNEFWGFDDDIEGAEEDELDNTLPDEAFVTLSLVALEKRSKDAMGDEVVHRAKAFVSEQSTTFWPPRLVWALPAATVGVAVGFVAMFILAVSFGNFGIEKGTTQNVMSPNLEPIQTVQDEVMRPDQVSEAEAAQTFTEGDLNNLVSPDKEDLILTVYRDLLDAAHVDTFLHGNGFTAPVQIEGKLMKFFMVRLTDDATVVSTAIRSHSLSGIQRNAIIEAIATSSHINSRRMRVGDEIYGYTFSDEDGTSVAELMYVPKHPSRMLDYWNISVETACVNPVVVSSRDRVVPEFGVLLRSAGVLNQISPCKPSVSDTVKQPNSIIIQASAKN